MTVPPLGLWATSAAILNSVAGVPNPPSNPSGQMGVGFLNGVPIQPAPNTQLVIAGTGSTRSTSWFAETATSLGAPYPGCYAFEDDSGMFMSVYQGNVKNGSAVVLWPLCIPGSGDCSNPSSAWHPDQFWCPEAEPE